MPSPGGTKVYVQIKRPEGALGDAPELVARVTGAAPHDEGGWLIWCNLKQSLTEAQVQALR